MRRRNYRREPSPCWTDPGGCMVTGRGWFTWDELHRLSVQMVTYWESLPEADRKAYAFEGYRGFRADRA